MNIFNRVTLSTLRLNKTRTLVTIIGVILSAAMICAVTTAGNSFRDYLLRDAVSYTGDWHASAEMITEQQLQTLLDSDEIQSVDYAKSLGYAVAENSKHATKPYYYVIEADESFAETVSIHLLDGRYPTDSSEIILPEHLSFGGGIDYEIGDTLTLEIGDRESDGFILNQNNPYVDYDYDLNEIVSDEYISINYMKTYTVVGFFTEPGFEGYFAPGFTVITAPSEEYNENAIYDAYVKFKDPMATYDYIESTDDFFMNPNSEVLMLMGISRHESFLIVYYGLLGIIIGLIVLGSVALIYNAFSISVSERTKQFGLLSSVGATKRQIQRSVRFEALVISLIGIPIGILLGVGGIGIALHILSNKLSELSDVITEVELRLCVSPFSILTAVVVSLVTVFISAWIPSRRATKVTAIEAIKQTKEIKKKRIRTSKLTYKLFGLAGVLASKYYKRNRKKYRATVVSLFMSIVLFVSASYFCTLLTAAIDDIIGTYNCDIIYYDIKLDNDREAALDLHSKIDALSEVDKVALKLTIYTESHPEASELSDSWIEYSKMDMSYDYETDTANTQTLALFVNDEEYLKLLKENGLSKEKFMDPGNPLAVVYDAYVGYSYSDDKYITGNIFSSQEPSVTITFQRYIEGINYNDYYYVEEYLENGETYYTLPGTYGPGSFITIPEEALFRTVTLNGGAIIDEVPYFMDNLSIGAVFIYPQSLMDIVLVEEPAFLTAEYAITADNPNEANAALIELIDNENYSTDGLFNYAGTEQAAKSAVNITEVLAYSFIVLISLIAIANVFNTISTNVALRRREFAMLRSVGMTSGDFNKMMCYECILYGVKSLALGLPAAIGMSYLIYKTFAMGVVFEFSVPVSAMVIASFSVFAVVFATMMYAVHKIKKDNTIDALKNENL